MTGTKRAVPSSRGHSLAASMCWLGFFGGAGQRWAFSLGHVLMRLSSKSFAYVPPTPPCWALGKAPGARPGCVWSGTAPLHPWASLASPVLSGHIQKRSKFCSPLPRPKATLFPTHFPAWPTAGASLSLRTNSQFYPPWWGLILRAPQIITERSTLPRGGLLVLPMSTSLRTYNRPCWKGL